MLTYKILANGYEILNYGVAYITQIEPYIPNPTISYEENAKAQIKSIEDGAKAQINIEQELATQKQSILELSMLVGGDSGV
ncbi:MAG: hypothetical protein RR657_07560 [Peptostreptococcaceae bacterium]